MCIEVLSLEKSKEGTEDILVITDHFTCIAQALPCRNQNATITAKDLYEKVFLNYGFPLKLHSGNQGTVQTLGIRNTNLRKELTRHSYKC